MKSIDGRGLTLIEVVAALVLAATAVTALLAAHSRSLAQLRTTRQQKIAADLAHELIRQWQLDPASAHGAIEGNFEQAIGWKWERMIEVCRTVPEGRLQEVSLNIYSPESHYRDEPILTYTWLEKTDVEKR